MKRGVLALLFVVLLTAPALAAPSANFLSINVRPDAYALQAGETAQFQVRVNNVGGETLERAVVTVAIPYLGVFRQGAFARLPSGDDQLRRVVVEIPPWAPRGAYPVMITLNDQSFRTTTWRYIYVVG